MDILYAAATLDIFIFVVAVIKRYLIYGEIMVVRWLSLRVRPRDLIRQIWCWNIQFCQVGTFFYAFLFRLKKASYPLLNIIFLQKEKTQKYIFVSQNSYSESLLQKILLLSEKNVGKNLPIFLSEIEYSYSKYKTLSRLLLNSILYSINKSKLSYRGRVALSASLGSRKSKLWYGFEIIEVFVRRIWLYLCFAVLTAIVFGKKHKTFWQVVSSSIIDRWLMVIRIENVWHKIKSGDDFFEFLKYWDLVIFPPVP